MVQLIIYAQEMRNLMEKQEFAASRSLNTLHPVIEMDGLLSVGGRLQQSTLPYQQCIRRFCLANDLFKKF